jgi:hypothetical protein
MRKPIRNGKSEIIGYVETWSATREFIMDKNSKKLGTFETDTGVTRDAGGKIAGRGLNQLLRLTR